MPDLVWSDELENDLAPMDDTHREFVASYNALLAAAPEDMLAAFDTLVAQAKAHFDLENGWMEAVDFPGCHRAEHDRVLAVMQDVRQRMARGDLFFARRLIEELPAWFRNHVNGMDAALAFHLASIGFDVASGTCSPPLDAAGGARGCACAVLSAEDGTEN
ncbi:hemerythrin domain-containing protein [Thauera aromatica]|uniref:Hemerythrin-like metal-binding protein n=1 Tax=Thauera aromatica K172 TaxID=44139 RepID=A0A2R4BLA0_THAAR|nr:hemerythrin domain-containing protein [Thauera aromatica]AVR87973.1 hemerythrin-like metal-binding protein [Thauera aromatica K172]MCK2094886.1 hemerythrin domain-containing protein [Thauera aromatica]